MGFETTSLENFNAAAKAVHFDSPRSVKTLEKLGIVPEELLRRDLKSFQTEAKDKPGLEGDPDFIKKKCEHYEAKRKTKLDLARAERKQLVQQQKTRERHKNQMAAKTPSPSNKNSFQGLDAAGQPEPSTLIKKERARVERMRERQKKEMQNMVAYEIKRQRAFETYNKQVELQNQIKRERDEQLKQRKIEFEERQRQIAEEKHRKQQEEERTLKKRQQKAMAEHNRKLAKIAAEEKAKADEKKEQERLKAEKVRQRLAIVEQRKAEEIERARQKQLDDARKERERQANIEAARKQAALEQELALQRKKEKFEQNMHNLAEQQYQQKMEYQRKEALAKERMRLKEEEKAREIEEARMRAMMKKQMMEQAKQKVEAKFAKQYQDFVDKTENTRLRNEEKAREQAVEEERKRQHELEKQRQRESAKRNADEMEEQRKQDILEKIRRSEESMAAAEAERARQRKEQQTLDRLVQEDRLEFVERQKRMDEYRKKLLLQKISKDDQRIRDMQQQQQQLAETRRQLRNESTQQREEMMAKLNILKNSTDIDSLIQGSSNTLEKTLGISLPPEALQPDRRQSSTSSPERKKLKDKDLSLPPSPTKTGAPANPPKSHGSPAQRRRSPSPKRKPSPVRYATSGGPGSVGGSSDTRRPITAGAGAGSSNERLFGSRMEIKDRLDLANAKVMHLEPNSRTTRTGRKKKGKKGAKKRAQSFTQGDHEVEVERRGGFSPYKFGRGGGRGLSRSRSSSRMNRKPVGAGRPMAHSRSSAALGPRKKAGAQALSKEEKNQIIADLSANQNGYLLMLLEKERMNEADRERMYATASNVAERQRLDKIFGLERAKASEVIKKVTQDHADNLNAKMRELNLISDDSFGLEFAPSQVAWGDR
mmetsp:Transcript_23692/g.46660  ORF Transcript_23692/g.46660 Transcript_23692/m.46660 type:complete len:882 (-) Transcript_23692:46-2691(-)